MQGIMCWCEHVCMRTQATLEIVNVLVNKRNRNKNLHQTQS